MAMKVRSDRQKLHGTFIEITISTLLIGLALSIAFFMEIYSIKEANRKDYNMHIQAAMNEYWQEFWELITDDRDSLKIVADLSKNRAVHEVTRFVSDLQNSNDENRFSFIGYYAEEEQQKLILIGDEEQINIPFEDLDFPFKQLILQALKGKAAVSPVFYEPGLQCDVIVYGVPVFDKNETAKGVVCGVKKLKQFEQKLNHPSNSNTKLDVVWMTSKGECILASKDNVLKQDGKNIFENTDISKEELKGLQNAVENQQTYQLELNAADKKYIAYFQPLGLNGWYLSYVDSTYSGHSPIYSILITINFIIGLTVLLFIGMMLYIRRAINNGNQELVHLAYYDKLTGAYNFEKFQNELVVFLAKSTCYSVAALNIRQFQYINQIIGKKSADRILKETANAIGEELNAKEIYCRASADQFYLLLNETDQKELRRRIQKIMDKVSGVGTYLNVTCPITLYAGVSIVQEKEEPQQLAQQLLHKAEFTQKHIPKKYKNTMAFYDCAMHMAENQQNEIESGMQNALEEERFKLFLQPKMNLKKKEVTAAEALVRWQQNDGTLLLPNQFIPTFEKNGFSAQLDFYMVEIVCRQLRKWIDAGYTPICISVNQSKWLFYQTDYVDHLCAILAHYAIEPRYIQLEILEGLAVENLNAMNITLKRLHEKGFCLALDDFGSGYSSLNVLSGLVVDEIKFDKDFLLESSPEKKLKNKLALKNIVSLAKDLNLSTVAEGVELEEDEMFACSIGCNYAQGYYYSHPIRPKEFETRFLSKK